VELRLKARSVPSRNVRVPPKRDTFIDGLRAISVMRVIGLHLLQRAEHPFVVLFSFWMPGMPLLFFVSGALAAKSLEHDSPRGRKRFWLSRGRRLLFPFWAFAVVVVGTCLVGQFLWHDAEHDLALSKAWRWILPIAGPPLSAAYDKLGWHLWFLSSLILMLASAPWTLALHRRAPWTGAALFFVAGMLIEFLSIPVPDVVRNTLLFGGTFQLGYGFADGRILRVRTSTLLAGAFCLAAFSLAFYFRRSPGAMLHAVPLALVAFGLSFVAFWLAVRETATRIFDLEKPKRLIRAINLRAYTFYLWGPVANDVAWRIIQPKSGLGYALDFALAIGLLLVFVRLLGPIEDWAARRGKKLEFDSGTTSTERQAA
jgi:peptidoglycan/LPS O-acetylase OafA/YrhL